MFSIQTILVVFFVGCSTYFFGFGPKHLFLDPGVLGFVFSQIIFLSFILYGKSIKYIPRALYILVLYMIYQVCKTYNVHGDIGEIVTVMRVNFLPTITAFILAPVVLSKSVQAKKVLSVVNNLTIILSGIYLLNLILPYEFYSAISKEGTDLDNIGVNLLAIPKFIMVVAFYLIANPSSKVFKNTLSILVLFIVIIFSTVRSSIIVILLSLIYYKFPNIIFWLKSHGNVVRKSRFIWFTGCVLLVLYLIISNNIFIVEILNKSSIEGSGTYVFRLMKIYELLIGMDFQEMIFGMGYIRDSPIGSYSVVLGRDTPIGAVLYAEGIVGVTMRLVLIFEIMRKLQNGSTWGKSIYIFVGLNVVNIIQTDLFTDLTGVYLYLLLSLKNDSIQNYKDGQRALLSV